MKTVLFYSYTLDVKTVKIYEPKNYSLNEFKWTLNLHKIKTPTRNRVFKFSKIKEENVKNV